MTIGTPEPHRGAYLLIEILIVLMVSLCGAVVWLAW